MKLFSWSDHPTAVEQATAAVQKAQEKHAALAVQLGDAVRELELLKVDSVEQAMELGHVPDDGGMAIAAAAATVATLEQAVHRASADVAEAQATLVETQDAEQRSASIAEIEALQRDMQAPAADLIDALDRLLPFAKRAGDLSLDGKATSAYLQTMALELPQAFETVSVGLKALVEGIQSGRARARLPEVVGAKPIERPAPPAQVGVLPKYSISWTDHLGQTRTSAPYIDQGLPPETAQKAIAAGIVVASDGDEARKLRPKRSGFAPDLNALVDLDVEHPQPPPPLPERWLRPSPSWKYSDTRQTAAPLAGWIGGPQRPTSGGEGF